MRLPHQTRPVQVWVDADIGIADLVERLNSTPGVRTTASCQGTLTDGGITPPHVLVNWLDDATLKLLLRDFDVTLLASHCPGTYENRFGMVHPR
jgi:hypothetical protein